MKSTLVNSFEEACELQGLDHENVLPDCSKMPEQHLKAVIAFAKMCIVHESLNGDWKPDWSNNSQPKYYPWFDFTTKKNGPSGVGLSFSGCSYVHSISGLGVSLFYKDRETAEHAGKVFIKLYAEMALVK
jgi:hypothetical protein